MKNVLVTGTRSGIGKAIAERLTAAGHNVTGTSRNPEGMRTTYPVIQLDVGSEESVRESLGAYLDSVGRIDVLVNNAGFGIAGPVEDTLSEEVQRQFETNFFGVDRMIRGVLPRMRKQGGGLIVNIGSLAGMAGLPFQAYYSASKFALEGYVEALRMELRGHGIHVVNVNPGDHRTGFTDNRVTVSSLSDTYREAFDRILSRYADDERKGSDPANVARLVEGIIRKGGGYRVRYLTGSFLQTFGVGLKGILGDRLFERLMVSTYKP